MERVAEHLDSPIHQSFPYVITSKIVEVKGLCLRIQINQDHVWMRDICGFS